MPEKQGLDNNKQTGNRDLFSEEPDIFGEDLKSPDSEVEERLLHDEPEGHGLHADEEDSIEEDERPGPVRRILVISGSIAAGIALGVGVYLFFTAGNRRLPEETQHIRAVPEPTAVPQAPAIPSEKREGIPVIPVRQEPQKPETAHEKEGAPEDTKKMPSGEAVAKEEQPYYVQAGVFANEANARAVAEKLKQKGYTPSVQKLTGKDNKAVFRVTAGAYAEFNKAVQISEVLNRQGIETIVRAP